MLRSVMLGLCVGCVLLVSRGLAAETESPDAAPETLMCEPGKLLFSDTFAAGPAKAWRVPKGKWVAVDGATQGTELKEDMHGAVVRTNVPARNMVIAYSFKLDGAKATTLSVNDAKGHNSRVIINANGFSVRKDDHDHAGPDKAELLQAVKTKIAPGVWHTLTVEINGPEFLARLDGKQIGYGSHAAIDVDKTNLGLTVTGESVAFKNFRVWDATPKSDWSSTKAKVIGAAGK
ncbi:family 16 glycoside hydrolase [Blastopirellula marina]|uniref:3-keto-alpha-glucoside-1,2-lyase/3-keto-2-hydroxy-glucal hydratase domain-containing protein n=1 Tax=Blastopirellula marina TaxID=124 RepID=A0A2S8G6U1_9BACT|nr:family 16 glycoside hydrolase [Blastopirellula marina]PQO40137.1 hypothetical protein C5Y98_05895 [Blastopirellula marina]PTL45504.1 hypothetical protein C5Y97_05895 [Blastopirellula marina]